ncbi:uncharacterized protein LOC116268314 [Nymphaea colorata]|nr:uncharacterized protein LOC116268314 [Nymphaea colorata]
MKCFKLADFGFSKKKADIGGTILGTEQFMSPEIFSELNPHWAPERKEVELKKLADNFSYSKAVAQTKKQITANCTPDIEDLFKKMFDLDPDNRITFSDIRKHPVFAKHFPVVAEASKILYSKKFQPSKIVKKSFINKLTSKKSEEEKTTFAAP